MENMEMEIVQTIVNVTYPLAMNYRKKFYSVEDELSSCFRPASILSMPEPLPPDIPRIIIPTIHGHSVLNVSLVSASLATQFDGSYANNWDHCKEYLKTRMGLVYSMIDTITGGEKEYTGFITRLKYKSNEKNALDMIKKSLLRNEGTELGNLCEASCKFIYKYEGKYYINVQIENAREFEVNKTEEGQEILKEKDTSHMRIELDVNDRLSANSIKGYKTSKEAFDELMGISSDFIKKKLVVLLQEGRIDYGE